MSATVAIPDVPKKSAEQREAERQAKANATREAKTTANKSRFLKLFAVCHATQRACDLARIAKSTVVGWKRDDPAFLAACEEAQLSAMDDVEEALIQRAMEYSDSNAQFFLKRRHPLYKDQPKPAGVFFGDQPPPLVATSTGRTVVTEVRQTVIENPQALTDNEIDLLEKLLIKAGGRIPARLPEPAPVEVVDGEATPVAPASVDEAVS